MRLKQVKLSGFKSFCDPTTFELPGQLVGVVGPNGCGKSNIIDATRWVLGESRASELRGESMQDVIFSGAADRKPAQRASVELVFDNGQGRIGGAWSGYAEISVRRILTRDGQSTYQINHQAVRRKDVHDIFLGTGLGPRAYAIIGQGTISRIIEARPEELRVFLEEAAGVSKYKERRKETESRLADTRLNLSRVGDILRELDGQIARLEDQAEVAGRYRALAEERDRKQRWLWLLRRDEALKEGERLAAQGARNATATEAVMAGLRQVEAAQLEVREQGDAANAELGRRQAAFYEIGSRISSVENELRFMSQNRERLQDRGQTLRGQIAVATSQVDDGGQRLDEVGSRAARLASSLAEAETLLASGQQERDAAVAADRQARDTAAQARETLADHLRQRHELEARQQAIVTALAAIANRSQKVESEQAALAQAPLGDIEVARRTLDEARRIEAEAGRAEAELEEQALAAEAERAPAAGALQAAVGKASDIAARISVLESLQQRMHSEERVRPWLTRHGFAADVARVWQRIKIEPGWELAVEAALRERVHSIEVGESSRLAAMLEDGPPGKLGLFVGSAATAPSAGGAAVGTATGGSAAGLAGGGGAAGSVAGKATVAAATAATTAGNPRILEPLATRVEASDPALAALVREWLDGCFAAETVDLAFAAREDLPFGGRFLVKAGHAIGRHDVSLFALDSDDDGVLARQQELYHLGREQRAQSFIVAEARAASERAEASTAARTAELRPAREAHAAAVRRVSAATIEFERLSQQIASREQTLERLMAERDELAASGEQSRVDQEQITAALAGLEAATAHQAAQCEAAEQARHDAEAALAGARDALQRAELALQGARFEVRSCAMEAERLREQVALAEATWLQASADLATIETELAALDEQPLRDQLQQHLEARAAAERALAEARNAADAIGGRLRELDEGRLRHQRELEPLRQAAIEIQLAEQAARLMAEQMRQSLADADADETALAAGIGALDSPPKPSWLQSEVSRLGREIERIGPVNLAALGELEGARERKTFLDSQSTDLSDAMATLENAIRTIDQESRSALQQTYDAVNREFGQLFPVLFGGGEAKLVLTGNEILDAGIQVMAQPPGKRNTSIHLLSGGEKALTAIALVFAIFKLNPAPFCLLDEVDAPLDDWNTERFCQMVKSMATGTQFVFITHNKITMEMGEQLIGVTMQERGVSRLVAVDLTSAAEWAKAA
ncbi:MAG: chromosome segregation protein SMC [Burkholderiaceae bacterium]